MPQTVLVLDDESDTVHLICESLRRQLPGVHVIGFSAPQEAVVWCATHEPDLCLVDYRMPAMSGVEFVRHLRAQDHLQGVPVIMITAQSAPTLQQEALDAGATDFLSKPINVRKDSINPFPQGHARFPTIKDVLMALFFTKI